MMYSSLTRAFSRTIISLFLLHFLFPLVYGKYQDLDSVYGGFDIWHKQCRQKDYASCYLLGRAYFEGYGILPNALKAKKILESACERNNLKSCLFLQDNFYTNDEVLELYPKTCELGDAKSCEKLIDIYNKEEVKDSQKIDFVLARLCQIKGQDECDSVASEDEKDSKIEFDKYLKLCNDELKKENGILESCGIVGNFYADGIGVKQDKLEASRYFEIACKTNREFCYSKVLDSILNTSK